MRHNLPVPNPQLSQQPGQQLIQRWRSPAAVRVELFLFTAGVVAVALVFLPLWFAIPVAVVETAAYGGMAVLGVRVTVDQRAGLLVFRVGLLTRRVRLADVTAVLVDQGKVSVARTAKGEISVSVWGGSRLHRWLRVRDESADVGHAIAGAVALAKDGSTQHSGAQDSGAHAAGTATATGVGRAPARTASPAANRPKLASAWLGVAGLISIAAALLVRVHWHNPVMALLAVLLALALGISGLAYLLLALWILLTERSARTAANATRAAQTGPDQATPA
jgi:hypothetical protein